MQIQSDAASDPRATDTPLEILADEIGAVAGRIEREVRQLVALELERLGRGFAEAQLRIHDLETQLRVALAAVKDGRDGEPGKDGRDGADGKDGAAGAPGEPGKDGANGRDGIDGAPGKDGFPGKDGSNGADGKDGLAGVDGRDGAAGAPGATGERGAPGVLPIVKAYAPGQVFYAGDVAVDPTGTYQALQDTAQPLTGVHWRCLARAGRDGRGFTVRGLWDAKAAYNALDVVSLDAASWAAKTDNPGPCPGEGWQLIAKQGKRGQTGEPGPRGDRGVPGKEPPSIAGWRPGRDYLAIPEMSDGSDGPPLDLRAFFETYHAEAS